MEFTFIYLLIVFTLAMLITSVTYNIKYKYQLNKLHIKYANEKNKNSGLTKKYSTMDIQDTKEYFEFLNELLTVKFSYYLNTFLIAYFISDKELDKKDIKKLKDDFYLDISKTLNDAQKNNLLRIFSKQGIELYIHQSFLRMLNDANIKFRDSGNGPDNVNKQTLNAIYNQG